VPHHRRSHGSRRAVNRVDQRKVRGFGPRPPPVQVWTPSPRVKRPRACVDGPWDAREKSRTPTIGSIAVMCPACWRGSMAAGPDGIRDPAPNRLAASKAAVLDGFSGSSVRPMVISFSSRPLASTRGSAGDRPLPVCPATRHRGPCHAGHPVVQSRPKPRGGSIASRSAMPSSAIARKASVMALSPGVGRGMAPAPNRYVTKPRRPGRAGTSHRSSSSPMRYEPSCWLMPRQRPCAACGGAVSTAIRWPACCPVFRRP